MSRNRGMQAAPDAAIWDLALREDAVIVSKEGDFAQRRVFLGTGPPVVWIRLRNTRRAELLAWFQATMPLIIEVLARGDTLIEVV